MSESIPTVGRIVHFVLNEGPGSGEHRAAMIVGASDGNVNLTIFLDSKDQVLVGLNQSSHLLRLDKVPYSELHQPSTWHWPERA